MTLSVLLAEASAAGVSLSLDAAGQVRMRARRAPPQDLLQALRNQRAAVRQALLEEATRARAAWLEQAAMDAFAALQEPDADLDAERAIIWGEEA